MKIKLEGKCGRNLREKLKKSGIIKGKFKVLSRKNYFENFEKNTWGKVRRNSDRILKVIKFLRTGKEILQIFLRI